MTQQQTMRRVLDLLEKAQLEHGEWPTGWPGVWDESEAWTAMKIAQAASEGLLKKS